MSLSGPRIAPRPSIPVWRSGYAVTHLPRPRSTEARRISRYTCHQRLCSSMRKAPASAQSWMNGRVQEVLSCVLNDSDPPSQAANWSGPSHGL